MNRIAVSVMVTRASDRRSVLLVLRSLQLKFLDGYLAFPGGVLDSDDEQISVASVSGGGEVPAPFIVAAARELFEETGLWLPRGRAVDPTRLRQYRERLLAGSIGFSEILRLEEQSLDASDFLPICRITTPPYSSRQRYDTRFLHCLVEDSAIPEIWPGELESGGFHDAADILRRRRSGEVLVAPPVYTLLEALATRPWDDFRAYVLRLTEDHQAGALQRDYYSCGIIMAPLETKTKAPATHTNFFVVGQDRIYLIQPSTTSPSEQQKLWNLIDSLLAEGRRIEGVLLTHGHPDHIGAAAECRRRYGAPLLAHELTAAALPSLQFDGHLRHGQELELGESPDGRPGWRLIVHHVPGHEPGHLAFEESRYGAWIVGDVISTLSSILIDPKDGHLQTYLRSLRYLESRVAGVLYPGHGPPVRDGRGAVRKALEYRRKREDQLLELLAGGMGDPADLMAALYPNVDAQTRRWAERSLESGLIKLVEEGKVESTPEGYRPVGSAHGSTE